MCRSVELQNIYICRRAISGVYTLHKISTIQVKCRRMKIKFNREKLIRFEIEK